MNIASDQRPTEDLGFLFRIEFADFGIPPGFKDRFESMLRDEAVFGRGLDCYLGALGGTRATYGFLWRPGGAMTGEDRQAFEQWLRAQPVTCKVSLGDLEPMETSDICRTITEHVFELDQLSAEDRRLAMEWKQRVLDKLAKMPTKRNPGSP